MSSMSVFVFVFVLCFVFCFFLFFLSIPSAFLVLRFIRLRYRATCILIMFANKHLIIFLLIHSGRSNASP